MNLNIKNYFHNRVKLIKLDKYFDERGFFYELFNKKLIKKFVSKENFVQDNISFSKNKNTIRGLHFQMPPHNQSKLIHVLQGSIFDVVVNINPKSKFFGQHKTFELKENSYQFLYISKDFAHGFCTLENNTKVIYKTSNYFNPKSEKTILWKDLTLSVEWPSSNFKQTISKKDLNGEFFKDLSDKLKIFK